MEVLLLLRTLALAVAHIIIVIDVQERHVSHGDAARRFEIRDYPHIDVFARYG